MSSEFDIKSLGPALNAGNDQLKDHLALGKKVNENSFRPEDF